MWFRRSVDRPVALGRSALSRDLPKTEVGNTGIWTTRIGFGTSRLHHVPRKRRAALLETAYALGIRHFDTAPAYGDGLAELTLGAVLADRRSSITIGTKFGIGADPFGLAAERRNPYLGEIARALLAIGRRLGARQTLHQRFEAELLEQSVTASLERLRTDYIDILFLHEPDVSDFHELEGLFQCLRALRRKGVIRAIGVAGSWTRIRELVKGRRDDIDVVQTGEGEWTEECVPAFTYGAISGSKQTFWKVRRGKQDVAARLNAALERRKKGVVLVSTTRCEHLQELV